MANIIKAAYNTLYRIKTDGEMLRHIINVVLLMVSCLLLGNILIQLSDKQLIKYFLAAVTIILELGRQYVVAHAKAHFVLKGVKHKIISILFWFVYTIYVGMIIIATIGFAFGEINLKDKQTTQYNDEKKSIEDDIKRYNDDADRYGKLMDQWIANGNGRGIKYKEMENLKNEALNQAKILKPQLSQYSEIKVDLQQDVYGSISRVIPIFTADKLKLYMIFVISIMIELLLLLTSWTIKLKNHNLIVPKKEEEQKLIEEKIVVPRKGNPLVKAVQQAKVEQRVKHIQKNTNIEKEELRQKILDNVDRMILYVNNMINGDNKLRSNEEISKSTGISLYTCDQIRMWMKRISVNQKPLLYVENHQLKSNFDKDTIRLAIIGLKNEIILSKK